MKETRVKLNYRGSLFWVIFWLIFFFPIAFVLLLTASSFEFNQTTYNLQYNGSRFWLCFWVLIFFPIAFVLLFVNGFSANIQQQDILQMPYNSQPPNTEYDKKNN
jgi:TRAP-type mannitol/chloroaromatic compound transport system permease small subunit